MTRALLLIEYAGYTKIPIKPFNIGLIGLLISLTAVIIQQLYHILLIDYTVILKATILDYISLKEAIAPHFNTMLLIGIKYTGIRKALLNPLIGLISLLVSLKGRIQSYFRKRYQNLF